MKRLLFLVLSLLLIPSMVIAGNSLRKISGDGQKVPLTGFDPRYREFVGKAYFEVLKVQVVNEQGQGVPGVMVGWVARGGPKDMVTQMDSGGGGGCSSVTDKNGIAVLSEMGGETKSLYCYYGIGKFQVVAGTGQAGSVVFDLEVINTPPRPQAIPGVKIEILDGDQQKVARERREDGFVYAYLKPLKVRVTKDGKPMPDLIVDFEGKGHGSMVVQLDGTGATQATVQTDKDGIAVLDKEGDGDAIFVYYGFGPFQVIASHGNVRVVFNLEVQ